MQCHFNLSLSLITLFFPLLSVCDELHSLTPSKIKQESSWLEEWRQTSDTHTGSTAPRLPPDWLYCNRTVCEEKNKQKTTEYYFRYCKEKALKMTTRVWTAVYDNNYFPWDEKLHIFHQNHYYSSEFVHAIMNNLSLYTNNFVKKHHKSGLFNSIRLYFCLLKTYDRFVWETD